MVSSSDHCKANFASYSLLFYHRCFIYNFYNILSSYSITFLPLPILTFPKTSLFFRFYPFIFHFTEFLPPFISLFLLFKIEFKPKPQAENLHKLGSHKLRINQIPNGIHKGVTGNCVQSLSSKNSSKLLLLIYYHLLDFFKILFYF